MKRFTHILFIIIVTVMMVLSGCNDKKKVMKKPPHLINRITLVNILAESYLIESTLQMSPQDSIGKDGDTIKTCSTVTISPASSLNRRWPIT